MKVLIIQTAFLGDVILATPLISAVKNKWPQAEVSFLTIPYSAPVLRNHPDLKEVLVFEKRGESGLKNTIDAVKKLKERQFNLALVPHRSLRSAVMVWSAKIPDRIGFDRSAGRLLLNKVVKYQWALHEVRRNLSLLGMEKEEIPPRIYPGVSEEAKTQEFLKRCEVSEDLIAMAPGSIWETKKWPEEYYHKLCELLRKRKSPPIILVGSERERLLCQRIAVGLKGFVFNATGEFTPIECASLLKRAKCLITNDSAAGHLAAAMGTRVISIFGPTTPDFGFAPYGKDHIIIEHPNLYCRPCRIHGSKRCPEKHFRCMRELTPDQVLEKVCKAFI